jgi:predicted DNA-binding WGR domain protein
MQDTIGEITKIKDKLGPFSGRISDLYNSKIGAYGPQYSALQTDMHNMASAWGRLHGNSVEQMKAFTDDLSTSKDADNLIAKIQRYQAQGNLYDKGGRGVPLNSSPQGGAQTIIQHSPSTGQDRYSTDGGKTWQAGKPLTQP